jgi:hypothetical protein
LIRRNWPLTISLALAAVAGGLQFMWLGLRPRILIVSEPAHGGLIIVAVVAWAFYVGKAIRQAPSGWLGLIPAPAVFITPILIFGMAATCAMTGSCP